MACKISADIGYFLKDGRKTKGYRVELFLFAFQSCTKDEECCDEQLCVWGQCSQNATRGEAGSTCQYQSDCRPDLCCALHKGTAQPRVWRVNDSMYSFLKMRPE